MIKGSQVSLIPATLADRIQIYRWAACSDLTSSLFGPPTYPEHPIPTYEQFCRDHPEYFFNGSAPLWGRCFVIMVHQEAVGQIYYNDIQERDGCKRTELDLWMRAERYCGKGYGSEALLLLCEHLWTHLGVQRFMVQPSARNPRAIRAYEKIGFVKLNAPLAQAIEAWGPNDHTDSVYMVKSLP